MILIYHFGASSTFCVRRSFGYHKI